MRAIRMTPVVLVLVVALALAACGQATSSSPGASVATASNATPSSPPPTSEAPPSSAPPSEGPTPTPTVTASSGPSGETIKVGEIATVVTDDLRVRSKPSVAEASKKLSPLLDSGRELFVVKGPVAGSGYRWYEVQPIRRANEEGVLPFGWVAAGGNGERWVAGGGSTCPKKPTTYREFVNINPLVGVACFGPKKLTFAARLEQPEATCGVEIGWTIEPDWLGSTCPQPIFLIADTDSTDSFNAVIAPQFDTSKLHPGVDEPDWLDVNVSGHFDAKAAQKCKGKSTEAGVKVPIGHDEIVTTCRAQFAITDIKESQ